METSFNSNVQGKTPDKMLLEANSVWNAIYTVYESHVWGGGRIYASICLNIYSATMK